MFNTEVQNRLCFVADGYSTIKKLKVKLKIATKEKQNDELEECINSIFTNTKDCEGDDDEEEESILNNDEEAIEVIHDDYNNTTTNSVEDGTTNMIPRSNVTVTKLGLSNIFDQGTAKLVDMKIPLVRERKQNRMKRSQAFFLNVHEIVTNQDEKANIELNSDAIGMIPHPWFRQFYRTIID